MAKNIPILEAHTLILSNGQTFPVEAHYRNVPKAVTNIPVIYFETESDEVPTVHGAELYHAWKDLQGDSLTAWYVPESEISSCIPTEPEL